MKKILTILTRLICLFFLLSGITHFSHAQAPTPERLKVFIDCHSGGCDWSYIRTEINIVDFVNDRLVADVHVLITDQNTGSGGDKYQLIFFGQNNFRYMTDTIYFDNAANNTDFEERELVVKYLKIGLTPYIVKTKMANEISIGMKTNKTPDEIKKDSAEQTKDPWNYWVFRTSVNGHLSAEEAYKNTSYSGSFSASKVTEDTRLGLSIEGDKNKSVYKFEDDNGNFQKYTVRNENYQASQYLVKSITDHWSWGYEAKISRNSFSNYKLQSMLSAGIEYNIFPYTSVNTKYFTIGYALDLRHNRYFDTTLYDKTKETLGGQSITTKLTVNQKWGTLEFGVDYHNYLHDWKYFNLEAELDLDIRITGGLSFNMNTSAELIRDQVFLPKQGATPQEVLTRRRQIASGYAFSTHFGLSYRFGSKLNNFVNPRFGLN